MSGDLRKALEDIELIRNRIAAGTTFRGYGPAALAATSALALGTWALQAAGAAPSGPGAFPYVATWTATAVAAVAIVGWEMRARARRHHVGMADDMVLDAAGRFLGAGVCGALLALVLMWRVPDAAWMLPGLWQVLVGLGVFASAHVLPRRASLAGAWYVVAGLTVLSLGADARTLEPWNMGLPFAVGQAILALALRLDAGGDHA